MPFKDRGDDFNIAINRNDKDTIINVINDGYNPNHPLNFQRSWNTWVRSFDTLLGRDTYC